MLIGISNLDQKITYFPESRSFALVIPQIKGLLDLFVCILGSFSLYAFYISIKYGIAIFEILSYFNKKKDPILVLEVS